MAGLGRRSHYRKHLTDAVLNDFPEPQENECIAKVVATRGGNQFDVLVSDDGSMNKNTPQLAILPSKFNKLIWVKRGDYCIVQTGDDNEAEDSNTSSGGGVRYLITHILYKEQIKHLKAKKLWPSDKEFETLENVDRKQHEEEAKWTSGEEDEEDNEEQDGIVYDTGIDDEFFINTNRLNAMQIQESESESSDDDDAIQQQETDDGIVYDTGDDDLFANTNRVAALRIQDSESDSSKDEHVIQQQETDDGIIFDTGNRAAAPQVQESISCESWNNEGDDEIQQQETDDVEYDTGIVLQDENVNRIDYDTSTDYQEEADSDDEFKDMSRAKTNDSVEYDTGNILQEEEENGIAYEYETSKDEQEEADGDIVYDTTRGADGLVVNADLASESDSSNDEGTGDGKDEEESGIV